MAPGLSSAESERGTCHSVGASVSGLEGLAAASGPATDPRRTRVGSPPKTGTQRGHNPLSKGHRHFGPEVLPNPKDESRVISCHSCGSGSPYRSGSPTRSALITNVRPSAGATRAARTTLVMAATSDREERQGIRDVVMRRAPFAVGHVPGAHRLGANDASRGMTRSRLGPSASLAE
jgi:hypothetical protein